MTSTVADLDDIRIHVRFKLAAIWTSVMYIIAGVLYSLFVLLTMRGAWGFDLFLGSVDISLALLIVWHAWTWPLRASRDGSL